MHPTVYNRVIITLLFFDCDKTKASSVNNFNICQHGQNLFELLDSEHKTHLEKFLPGSYVFVNMSHCAVHSLCFTSIAIYLNTITTSFVYFF